jgi:EAL domain-containing protein (putative c-di-GMP-specific phosphodiesterase class I)
MSGSRSWATGEKGVPVPLGEIVDPGSHLERVVSLAQRHLGVDAVCIAEQRPDGVHYCRAASGDAAAFDVVVGAPLPPSLAGLTDAVVSGTAPAAVRKARSKGRARTQVAVPLLRSDTTAYGAIIALARSPRADLDDRDLRLLSMSADLLLRYLDDQRDLDGLRAGIGVLIHERRLDIATQPIFDLREGNCMGVEALARFPSGWGSPDATFRAADAAGLGVELERLAVQQAWPILEQLRPRQFLTVNLSPVAAVALAERATAYAELPLNQLVVEITEHTAIDSYAPLRTQLRPLRKLGLRVAVDDAGAGYASLRHVVELRPDFIKVDRDLVHGIADDHARRVAVSAFVLLSLDLNATVIAEGLERPEDLATLQDLGVDAAQGYLLGRPSTAPGDLAAWLRRDGAKARSLGE